MRRTRVRRASAKRTRIKAAPTRTNPRARAALALAHARPVCRPEWVVGTCPECGGPLVENRYWTRETGHRHDRECWESLGTRPTCSHRVRLDGARPFAA